MAGLVKHYQNTMKGIPQLTNNWGAMITLLDAVLVNGFNHVPILSLSKSNQTSITATINLGSGHGFIDRQVVRIAGSTNGWDGDYKVLSADSASITVECTAQHPSMISGAATCFTAPFDFEIVFQTPADSTEPKRAYRSTDPESLGLILLVHDFCVNGAAVTGSKFAKVGVVSGMIDIDTIVGNQMPFDQSSPNANWNWDGTNHGWAKWYYARTSTNNANDTSLPSTANRSFYLSGDNNGFAISINAGTAWASYVFSEFYDTALRANNLVFSASGLVGKRAQTQALSLYFMNPIRIGTTYDLNYAADGGYKTDWVFWFNRDGLDLYSKGGYPIVLNMCYLNSSGNSIWTYNFHYDLKNDYYFPMILNDSEGYIRGQMPFLRFNAAEISSGLTIDIDQGKFFTYRIGNFNKATLTTHALEQR
ncbi:hypothetical protein [Acinetobacter cumulans]|uniref:hypothetical protein n=1 Tax=Acinetobacter cumulans TaxID=2136182 RepID=UPI001444890F|nr:hypothetical protein [Acinetobacter cumulans]